MSPSARARRLRAVADQAAAFRDRLHRDELLFRMKAAELDAAPHDDMDDLDRAAMYRSQQRCLTEDRRATRRQANKHEGPWWQLEYAARELEWPFRQQQLEKLATLLQQMAYQRAAKELQELLNMPAPTEGD
jgi:hypothetical protein